MSETQPHAQRSGDGAVRDEISAGIVGLLKEFYGVGPTEARTYLMDDLVVCLMRGGYTRIERTLRDEGRTQTVLNQRHEFQEVMQRRFRELVAEATGRQVIGFMSGNQAYPEMTCEVFVLEPSGP